MVCPRFAKLKRDYKVEIRRQYIVDENNHRIAVQIDISTFNAIEELLENRGLYEIMQESIDSDESMNLGDARRFYATQDK